MTESGHNSIALVFANMPSRRQTDGILTRELIERIGLLHADSFRDARQNT
jgi:hypothetical protein